MAINETRIYEAAADRTDKPEDSTSTEQRGTRSTLQTLRYLGTYVSSGFTILHFMHHDPGAAGYVWSIYWSISAAQSQYPIDDDGSMQLPIREIS